MGAEDRLPQKCLLATAGEKAGQYVLAARDAAIITSPQFRRQ